MLAGGSVGSGGSLAVAVGAGAGGRLVGDRRRLDADTEALGPADQPARRRDTELSTVFVRRFDQPSTVATGDGWRAGAGPMPVTTPRAGTGGGAEAAGTPPTAQPMVTANGNPKATMPRKTDPGERDPGKRERGE